MKLDENETLCVKQDANYYAEGGDAIRRETRLEYFLPNFSAFAELPAL